MNVLFQFVDLATSMREERGIKLVRSVKPDTSALKVESLASSCYYYGFFWVLYLISVEITGSPRVEGDEDEDDIDDLDNEFDYGNLDALGPHHAAEGMYSHLNTGRGSHPNASHIPGQSEHEPSPLGSEIPLLTYGEEVGGVLQHSLFHLVMLIVDIHNQTLLMCQDYEISSDQHALVPHFMGDGNRVHPMPSPDRSSPCKSWRQ